MLLYSVRQHLLISDFPLNATYEVREGQQWSLWLHKVWGQLFPSCCQANAIIPGVYSLPVPLGARGGCCGRCPSDSSCLRVLDTLRDVKSDSLTGTAV